VLFQEFIFSGDIVHASFCIRLRKLIAKQPQYEENDETQKNKKDVKGKLQQQENKYDEVPLQDKIRLKLELYDKNGEIILQRDFYNSVTLHNIILEGNTIIESSNNNKKDTKKNEDVVNNTPYTLKCYFDKTELPKEFNDENYTKGLNWLIRVFSTDTLGFAKDTSKEDRERNLIESWEKNEPGRAEKAQKARRRFLLEKQIEKGKKISQEDKAFLDEPRERKKFNNEVKEDDNKKEQKKKNDKKDNKRGTIKNINEDNKDTIKHEILNFNKTTSVESNHSSLYIKNYLHYVYDKRKIEKCSGNEPSLQTYIPTEETNITEPNI
jgi:hypothetical protein